MRSWGIGWNGEAQLLFHLLISRPYLDSSVMTCGLLGHRGVHGEKADA